jgi:hypothetical protein
MFWDGDRWVEERAYEAERERAARASQSNPEGPRASATGVIVVALIALFALGVPFVGAVETTPVVVVSPDSGPAGIVVEVNVAGLDPRTRAHMTWDGVRIPDSDFRASREGSFAVGLRIPDAAIGVHEVAVASEVRGVRRGGASADRSADLLATTSFTLDATAPPATPSPTPTPRPDPTPRPTEQPTATPLPTVVPTPTREPDPTPDPTPPPDPTQPPDPDPTKPPEPDPTPDPTPDPSPEPPSLNGAYGSGIAMDGIGNTELGGTTNDGRRHYAAIFKSTCGRIVAFRQQIPNPLPGYSGGDGGVIRWTLRTATSTAPTNNTVGHGVDKRYGMSRPDGIAPEIKVDWKVDAGSWYALVGKNVDSNPRVNFTSIESIALESVNSANSDQPAFPDGQWQTFYSDSGTGNWQPRYGHAMTAQLQFECADGKRFGVGYVYRRQVLGLSNGRAEVFTPNATRSFDKVCVRAWGSGELTVVLERAGEVVARGKASDPRASSWTCPSGMSGEFDAGVRYRLILRGDGMTTYSIEKGSAYGFHSNTYFSDGSVDGDSRADLQFFFR